METQPPRAPAPDLSGQVAVITGGVGAIGRAIAERFVEARARVVVADLAQEASRRLAAEIGHSDQAVGLPVDVRSPESVQTLMASTLDTFGRLDILVNAAGIIHADKLLDIPPEVWRNVFAVNLDGALYCLQRAARIMVDQEIHPATQCRGKIINISSQGAEFPIPTSAAYGASKRALNYLTETAAASLLDHAISVTAVYPGMVYEGMWRSVNLQRARLGGEAFEERIRRDLAETPSGRFQAPGELADIALFVAGFVGLGLSGKTVWSDPHVA